MNHRATLSIGFRLLAILIFLFLSTATQAQPDSPPVVSLADARGARGQLVSVPITYSAFPEGISRVELVLNFHREGIKLATFERSFLLGTQATSNITPVDDTRSKFSLTVSHSFVDGQKAPIGMLTFELPDTIERHVLSIEQVRLFREGETEPVIAVGESASYATSLITKPVTLFAFLAGVVAAIYWISAIPSLGWFFRYFPPLIWMYFVPMVTTTLGITPDSSTLYSPFMSQVLLPAVLVLLLIPSDVRSIAKLGPKAVIVMLIATAGIAVGAITSFWFFHTFFPGSLPPDTWKGVAALSGSWIGGSPNMFAVLESVGTPANIIGPLVVVDTVLAYSWLGILIALSAYQHRIDKFHRADSRVIDEISMKLEAEQTANARAPKTADMAYMIGIAFVVSQVCLAFGGPIYNFVTEDLGFKALGEVINAYGWAILLITAAGLLLSTTRVRHLDYCGASSLGYVGLYLLLTTYGARANLQAVLEVPMFFALGGLWLLIHIAFLYVGMRLTRAPLFLAATSSMANIGGTASAPVVAASYNPSMAPVGLLMAILGSVLGTPVALFIIATTCRAIAGG